MIDITFHIKVKENCKRENIFYKNCHTYQKGNGDEMAMEKMGSNQSIYKNNYTHIFRSQNGNRLVDMQVWFMLFDLIGRSC